MTAVTVSDRKEIVGLSGVEVVYATAVQDGYTYQSRFGKIRAAFFAPTTAVACGASWSNGTVTVAVGAGTVAGALIIFGE